MNTILKKHKVLLCTTLLIAWSGTSACDLNLNNGQVGPWDYYDAKNSAANGESSMGNIKRVANVHLTKNMLQLTGRATGPIAGDLDYTLRAIPNHPDALNLASRMEKRLASPYVSKLLKYEHMKKSAECYFQRALKLAKHAQTYAIYAIHLHRNQKYAEAKNAYLKAIKLDNKPATIHYNFALTLIKLEEYKTAEQHAKIAYKMEYPFPGVRKQLQKVGFCNAGCE